MLKQLFLFIVFSTLAFSQSIPAPQIAFHPKSYVCYRSGGPITVDGRINESAWTKAPWTDDFIDIEGPVKPVPRFRTRAKMLWDSTYFYIAAELREPDIWATLKHRDDIIFYDNDFEIFIDPDGDTRDYCEFEMNALNTVWDLLLTMPYRDVENAAKNGWDIKGLKTGTKIYGTLNHPGDRDSCWTVEVAFPWSGFREITSNATPPLDNDQWRINFSRVEWKTFVKNGKYQKQINPATNRPWPEDNWVWSPQGVVNMHYPEMWGYVQFSTKPVGTTTVAFINKPEEQAKWMLRQIYYAEKKYFETNGSYTSNLRALGLEVRAVPEYEAAPMIECTPTMFAATLQRADRTSTLHIRTDGLTWTTQVKQ
ncbi:MAG TPA: carbohydrate-binding family 9-like protein [Bacteroidota bacterium]|nr:carbohydrate-binding family 9-like protein [Bacteroidota bacterium]